MRIEILLLSAAAIINVVLGAVVLARTRRAPYGWFFALTMLFVALWAVGDCMILLANTQSLQNFAYQIFYAVPMLIPIMLLCFSLTFPNRPLQPKIGLVLSAIITPLVVLVAVTPQQLLSAVDTTGPLNVPVPSNGLFTLYAVYFSAMFLALYVQLFISMRRERDPLSRAQLKYTLVGTILSSVPALLTNLSLPLAGIYTVIWAGPLFTSIFVSVIALSIIRHKMFDIRLVVARTIGYALSVLLLATAYGFVVFGLINLVTGVAFSFWVQAVLSVTTAVAGLTFHRIQKQFDKFTNSLFYQDAYDANELLEQLNKVLVSSLDVSHLMKESASVIANNLKLDHCSIVVNGSDGQLRSFVPNRHTKPVIDIARLHEQAQHSVQFIIVADSLPASQKTLKTAMQDNNVAVIVRLAQHVRHNGSGLGYIVLGSKKSGNPYGQFDIRNLENIANELVIAIQNALHYEEIQQFNLALQSKIDEATRKLRRTNEKLKALDEAKDDFVSMASHQLRTPLTSIKGYTSMVLEGDAGRINATQRKLLEQSFASSQRMVYLIADLLNVSRLKTGKFIIEAHPVNIAEIVQQEIGQLKETAAGRSLELTYEMPEAFPTLQLDETKIRQVIMNFIDNAIYYTPAGGHIAVKVLETPSSVEFRVVDDGIGVPAVERPHLFTKFYRAGHARTARPDGTGLGLFMAKKVVVAQGGALIFETSEGKGSTFGFVFSKTTQQTTP